jgi:hypothetical protein
VYPDAASELSFRSPYQLLVATILSAQATDVSVNAATPALFDAYPTPDALAAAAAENLARGCLQGGGGGEGTSALASAEKGGCVSACRDGWKGRRRQGFRVEMEAPVPTCVDVATGYAGADVHTYGGL